MTGVLALLSAAAALGGLPQLPARGLALETKGGVQLQTMSGRRLTDLPALDLATDQAVAHKVVMRDSRGRLFVLDPHGRRLVRTTLHRGCRATDRGLLVCARTIRRGARTVVRAPRGSPVGHWVWAELAPRGDAILAQWESECEVPLAYLAERGTLRVVGAQSVALGWLRHDLALVHVIKGDCGLPSGSGIYAVPRQGLPTLLLRTPARAQYLMWGG